MKHRLARVLAALFCVACMIVGLNAAATSAAPTDTRTSFTISSLDLHDTQMTEVDGTFYLYGTMYGCGYEWYIANTPWCGFGASSAPTPQGPWTRPVRLFSPRSWDPFGQRSWQDTCGGGRGQGCFNPRMIRRSGWGSNDGTFILWFNSPRHYTDSHANAYNVMGCNGPLGPCGPTAGAPHGSYTKPSLDICSGNGDFGMITPPAPARPAIICSMPSAASLSIQQLNWWGVGGSSGVGVSRVAGMSGPVEGPGGWWDADSNQYVITFSDQGCGFCAGTPAGYATSPTLYSGWSAQTNVGWGAPAYARRDFSSNSCGGQPRTVAVLDGQPWQILDLWQGTRNETQAPTHMVPLSFTEQPGAAGDGQVWRTPLKLEC